MTAGEPAADRPGQRYASGAAWLCERPVLGDGAMGTMLLAAGLPPGDCPERWCLERPEAVLGVHAAYLAAGARWVLTNTFGATRPRLEAYGLARAVRRINEEAVRLARAAGARVVLGCLGPVGPDARAWEAAYAEQTDALAAAGVDGFMVETIVRWEEGLVAVRMAAAAGCGPVIASYTPSAGGGMADGRPPEAAVAFLEAGAAALGVNCGTGPESLLEPAQRLTRVAAVPVLAAPSAGLPVPADAAAPGGGVYPVGPDAFALAAIKFQEAGVSLIAGCCGTTPEHIRAAASALAAVASRSSPSAT